MILAIIAQIASEIANASSPLYTYGPLGVFCAYFMWRGEGFGREIRTLSHRIDGLTRAMLVDALSRENIGPMARKFAQEMLAKIESDAIRKQ